MTPGKERQRAYIARLKARGLVPVTVYVRKEDAKKVRKFAADLNEPPVVSGDAYDYGYAGCPYYTKVY